MRYNEIAAALNSNKIGGHKMDLIGTLLDAIVGLIGNLPGLPL